jgi:hypothetical protein|tara:strand:+ start:52 stop:363 length:312 start_codon:yes stop_codon:yes gene_type:complete
MKLFYLIFTIIFSTGKCFHNNFFFNQKINFVKDISHFLPNVDTIGHNVLLNNDKIINNILNNDLLSNEIKKELILDLIKLSQYGDNFGTDLLHIYYNFVENFL